MLRPRHVMSSLRAFGPSSPLEALQRAFGPGGLPPKRLLSTHCLSPAPRQLPRRTWGGQRSGAWARAKTTAARQASARYRYPPEINVYRFGTLGTSFIGTLRLGTLIMLLLGTFFAFPAYLWSYLHPPETKAAREKAVKWYIPCLILVGSWLPALLAFSVFAPWVHQIHVCLPTLARRSHEDLMRWARNVPRKTTLSISVIRAAPWPTAQYVVFEDLSRLSKSFTRLTNLEHNPPVFQKYLADNKQSRRAVFLEGLSRTVYGRFYVNQNQTKDKSAVPGVWDEMWAQIPMQGEMERLKVVQEQKRAEAKAPGPRVLPPKPRP